MYAEYTILYDESVVTSMQSLMSRSICLLVRDFECGEFASGMRNLELSVSLLSLCSLGSGRTSSLDGEASRQRSWSSELMVIAFLLVRHESLRCRHASCILITIQMLLKLVSIFFAAYPQFVFFVQL